MAACGVLRTIEGNRLSFWCPGCEEVHMVNTNTWTFNGNYDKPTFSPSILVTGGHYVSGFKQGDSCWCTYNKEHPDDPAPFICNRCHIFVVDGEIKFLGDCTHKLAGQTMALKPYEEWYESK